MWLIVGLGNPGRGYTNNRHNTGFICLSYFARTQGIRFNKKQAQARTGTGSVGGNEVTLARPQTYMNLSGQSVSRLVNKLNLSPDNLLVIHDDLDLPLARIRIRRGGGSGGHRGIESVIDHLGNESFIRLRIGIGRPATTEDLTEICEDDVIAHVLSDFTPDERQAINQITPRVSEAVLSLLIEGPTAAMNKYN